MKKIMLFAGLLIVTGSQAHAGQTDRETGPVEKVQLVSYQASELATDEGIHALQARLQRAAFHVCNNGEPGYLLSPCVTPTAREAFAQLDRAVARWRGNSFAGLASITVRAR